MFSRILLPLVRGHVIPVMRNMHLDFIKRARFEDPPAGDPPAGGGGGGLPDFESLPIPENFKDSAVGKYQNIGELIKGYDNAQKLIGAKGVILPTEKSTPEEVEKFYNTLGRPEKADGYKFSPIENLHPNIKITPEDEGVFRTIMHKAGIPQKQADSLRKEYFGLASQMLSKQDEAITSGRKTAETALRQEWGADYDANLQKTQRLIDKFGGKDGRTAFGELGNNPHVLKTLATIAKQLSEDSFIPGSKGQSNQMEAAAKLKSIMDDKKHPYWVQGPGHDDALKEVMRLQDLITPNDRVERA